MIVSLEQLDIPVLEKLNQNGCPVQVIGRPCNYKEILMDLQPEVLICRDKDDVALIIDSCPSIRMLFSVEVGVEDMPFEKLIDKNIKLANTSGISADIMSNYVMSCILCSASKLKENINNQQNSAWKKYQCTETLNGKTLLVVGAGRTGRMIAKKAKAFGLYILGIQRTIKDTDHFDEMGSLEQINYFLHRADYVVCTLPLTCSTHYLFSKALFAAMKRTPVFINVSRGRLVNELDLINALDKGQIKEAYLDVFEKEPLPCNHAFWQHPQIVVTPHQAGRMHNYMEKAMDLFVLNYRAYKNGEQMPNEVNLYQGY